MTNPKLTFEQTVPLIKKYNDQGIAVSASFLPVKKTDPIEIRKEVDKHIQTLQLISDNNLNSDITVKLHQFGIYGDKKLAEESIEEIVSFAAKHKNFVWIDMEQKQTVDGTIEIFNNMNKRYKNVGICLQAYLKRTEADMNLLLKQQVPIRLVKGFYKDCQFESWNEVTENYKKLMKIVLLNSSKPAIASHDLEIQDLAKEIIRTNNLKTAELQFFSGVRDDYAAEAVRQSFNVRVYVTYGRLIPFLITGVSTFDNMRHAQRLLHFEKVS